MRSRWRSSTFVIRARAPASSRVVELHADRRSGHALRAAILRSLILDTVIREEATKLGLEATSKEVAAEVAADAQQAGGQARCRPSSPGPVGRSPNSRMRSAPTSTSSASRTSSRSSALPWSSRSSPRERTSTPPPRRSRTTPGPTGTASKGGDLGVLTPPSSRRTTRHSRPRSSRSRWARTRRRRSTTPAATTS